MGSPPPIVSTIPATPAAVYVDAVNVERKHLETLLQQRINFHLLFASVFVAGMAGVPDPATKFWALAMISVVSGLIVWALCRTYDLVEQALTVLRNDETQPYSVFSRHARIKTNANSILLAAPVFLTTCFVAAAVFYGWKAWGRPVEAVDRPIPSVVYQIEDHSDRSVTSGPPIQSQTTGSGLKGKKSAKQEK
jgi:hypothetical protein